MNKIYLIIIISFLTAYTLPGMSQQNPSGTEWKSINAGNYEIIFPQELTPLGQRVANLMVHYENYNYISIKADASLIPIVLINNITDPNGFVAPAPFYSHWFTTPSSFSSIEWFQSLAIHEGRHMVQMNKLKQGPGKQTWRVLLGDTGSALFQMFYIPPWFMEGDAINMETALTWGGRGRLPWFSLWHRTLELSDTRYSYYRSYLGSYDDLYPYSDFYRLGYLLSTYIRTHYGKDVWDRVLSNTGKYFLFHNFDRSLQIETGKTITELYRDAMNQYSGIWAMQLAGLDITEVNKISSEREGKWDSFYYPHFLDNDTIAAIHFTRDREIRLVKINSRGETGEIIRLPFETVTPALMAEKSISIAQGKILWRELQPDARWGYRNYSNLKIYNIESKKSKRLTSKGKYISSALSPDGTAAAAVEYTPDMKYYINIIRTDNGKILKRTDVTDTGYIYDPAFSDNGERIAFSSLSIKGNRLLLFDIESESFKTIIDYRKDDQMKAPVFYRDYIIYSSHYSGIDNIYAVNINSGKKFQITSRPYGAYYPSVSPDGETLYFNDYSINGYSAVSIKLDPSSWIPIEKLERKIINDIQPIVNQELSGIAPDEDDITEVEYEVKDYYPQFNFVNVYGWLPSFDSTSNEFYFSVYSRDVLHTTDISVSYIRNFNENTNAGAVTAIFSGLYPVITLTGGYGSRTLLLDKDESESGRKGEYARWNEAKGSAGISLPLNYSRGIHKNFLRLAIDGGLIHIMNKDHENIYIYEDINRDGTLNYLSYSARASHIVENNMNAVAPRMGQVINIAYYHTPGNSDYDGSLFSSDLTLYFPGIIKSHSIILTGAFENTYYENYAFPSIFLFPRGYDAVRHEYLYKGGIDYVFPILNLSSNIWKLTYIKRINGAIFFDYGTGETGGNRTVYPSAGFELTARQNLISNIYLDLEIGLRYSRCFETDENKYDFILKSPM